MTSIRKLRASSPMLWAPLAGLVLLFLGWRTVSEVPEAGLDPSWGAALHMAAHGSYAWGHDLVFTYGPLGWLRVTRYWYTDSGAWAMAYTVATRLALFSVLWLIVRRQLGSILAILILLPTVWVLEDASAALAFAGAVALIQSERGSRNSYLLAAGLGVLGGIELLGKVNAGVTILVIGGMAAVLGQGGLRDAVKRTAVWGAAAGAALLLAWVGTGQPVDALVDYVHNALRVISGYSAAMSYDAGESWNYWLAPILAGVGGFGIWALMAERETRTRAAVVLLWLAWCFFYFKAAYVRHDAGHIQLYFSAAAPALAAIPLRRDARFKSVLLLLLAPFCFLWVTGLPVSTLIAPSKHQSLARQQISGLWSGERRAEMQRLGRQQTALADKLPRPILREVGSKTVAVEPFEQAVVWLNRLRWDPLPVLQDYQAYTSGLDGLGEAKLRSDNAPERLLYASGQSIDSRLASFDTPATARARLCRYSPIVSSEEWVVLERTEYRCSAPRLVATTPVAWGQPVPVPNPSTPDAVVFVRIAGAGVAGSERLRSLLFRAHDRTVTLGPSMEQHRVAPGTLTQGLPLLAGPKADLAPPFNVAASASSLQIDRAGDPPTGPVLRFDFYEFRNPGLDRLPAKARVYRCRSNVPPCVRTTVRKPALSR